MTPPLAYWKRVVVALQLMTFPVWYLPFCLWVGIRETFAEIIPMFVSGWQAVRGKPW